MRVDGGDASRMAQTAAEQEAAPAKPGTPEMVRRLRISVGMALKGADEALGALGRALEELLRFDPEIDFESAFPDGEYVNEVLDGIARSHADLLRWLASLPGRESLARLMLEGESQAPRVEDLKPNSEELGKLPERAIVGAEGLMVLTRAPMDKISMRRLEARFAPLFEVSFTQLDPGGVRVSTVAGPEFSVTVNDREARDSKLVHARLMEAADMLRSGTELGEKLATLPELIDPESGRRFRLAPNGTLFENGVVVSWPGPGGKNPLFEVFPPNSPEPPSTVTSVMTLSSRTTYHRVVRDRRDHDCDVWERKSSQYVWSTVNELDWLMNTTPMEAPRHD